MWRIDRQDGENVNLSFHTTAQQVVDAIAKLRSDDVAEFKITNPSGHETPEHIVAALAAEGTSDWVMPENR